MARRKLPNNYEEKSTLLVNVENLTTKEFVNDLFFQVVMACPRQKYCGTGYGFNFDEPGSFHVHTQNVKSIDLILGTVVSNIEYMEPQIYNLAKKRQDDPEDDESYDELYFDILQDIVSTVPIFMCLDSTSLDHIKNQIITFVLKRGDRKA